MFRFERTDHSYDIWVDEKKERSEEDLRNQDIVARGYTEYVVIQDYPLRGRPVYLHMRKNKWWNKATGEIFSYNLNARTSPTKAMKKMNEWYEKVRQLDNASFRSVVKTFRTHAPTILNYFRRRATNHNTACAVL